MRLCLISLDAVSGCDAERLVQLPHLRQLMEEGAFCQNIQTVYPTITYPIHCSLLTGCYPARHGIGHNQPLQPDTKKEMRKWYWEISQIRAKTLHQAAWEKKMRVASILWPVTGKNPYVKWNFPEIMPLPGENAALKMMKYGTAPWLLNMELRYGKQRPSIKQPHLDAYAILLCEKLLARRNPPDVLTVHFVDCDAMRHWYGVESREAHQAMERLDAYVGRIVEAVKKAGLYEETLFCIVSDHGQQDAKNGVLLDRQLKAACGARAQSLGMGAYIFADDLSAAKREIIAHQQELRIKTILEEEDLRSMQGPGDVHLAVEAEEGACFIDEEEETFGEHGFSIHAPQAQTLLFLSGPGIRKNHRIPSAHITDIAPTLARALGLDLPHAQGKAIGEVFI
ncbi:MAG: alkaline phosphatase family protein [Clostridia bacterium]|nr:alkaline phosphatase family protein [Clostridia bacterium]